MRPTIKEGPTQDDVDYVDLYEQLLYQRASRGIRPVLYVSSYTDLECTMLMLLDGEADSRYCESQQPAARPVGYQLITS
jgi:hypothetical protein